MRVSHLPVYDQSNGWQEILPPLPEATVLTGDVTCDFLAIGGGVAYVWGQAMVEWYLSSVVGL